MTNNQFQNQNDFDDNFDCDDYDDSHHIFNCKQDFDMR